jgi:uncharacterized membrane protein
VFLGYGFAFAMISIWWIAHHRLFRYIVRYDTPLVQLNLVLLFEIAVMPFVLSVYSAYSTTQVAVVLFASVQVAAGLTLAGIWWHATTGRKLVSPQLSDRVIRYFRQRGLVTPVVFLASIGVSFVNVEAAQVTWLFAFVAQRFLSKYGAD